LELHGAHGYLIHSFLSPISNQRNDNYGGSFENRIRFLLETARAVRAVWPANKPLAVRVSASDWATEGGWTIDETVELARQLASHGVDIIDVSSGGTLAYGAKNNTLKPPYAEGYQVPFAARIKKEVPNITVMAVGNINSGASCESFISTGQTDLIAVVIIESYAYHIRSIK
jgi:2,4-dienoyl-CoA reductase-like NADH-dependent reductase (Old Yellow Enzyme family)